MTDSAVSLRSSVIVNALAAIAALLVAAGTGLQLVKFLTGHDNVLGLVELFNLDAEHNLPTFYSVLLLLVASLLLASIAALEHRARRADVSRWALLATGFLLMAVDEECSLHEMLNISLKSHLGGVELGFFYYVWVIPGALLVAMLGVYFLGFLRRLPPATSRAFVFAAAVYLGGALGVEVFEGWFHEQYGTHNLGYSLFVAVEEGMEMAGVILFIRALLDYLARQHPRLGIRVFAPVRQVKSRRTDANHHVGEPERAPSLALVGGRQMLRRGHLSRRE